MPRALAPPSRPGVGASSASRGRGLTLVRRSSQCLAAGATVLALGIAAVTQQGFHHRRAHIAQSSSAVGGQGSTATLQAPTQAPGAAAPVAPAPVVSGGS